LSKIAKSRVSRIPFEELEEKGLPQLAQWLTRLHDDSLRQTRTFFISFTSTFTAVASSITNKERTVKGVVPDDLISIAEPSKASGSAMIIGAYSSATDQVTIRFGNFTASGAKVQPKVYKIKATRF